MPVPFQGSSFLLTYPQDTFNLDDDFDTALAFFNQLGLVKFLRVGCERHASGDPHWHAVVLFAKPVRLAASAWDFRNKHPNVQSVGRRIIDWRRCVDYVAKDGEYRDFGSQRHSSESVWSAIPAADNREAALELIAAGAPRDYVIHRRSIDYALEALFPMRPTCAFQPRPAEAFRVPDECLQWLSSSLAYAK